MTGSPENLHRIYAQATDYERRIGRDYYWHTRRRLNLIARHFSIDPAHAVFGVFAALSPNNSEEGNFIDCCSVFLARHRGIDPAAIKVTTYSANKAKAFQIAAGSQPLSVLRGMKVRAFYSNIANPLDEEPVTVDGHIFNAWLNQRQPLHLRTPDNRRRITPDLYNQCAGDMRQVASRIGLRANQAQSTIWLAWRRIHRILYKPPQIPLFPPTDEDQINHLLTAANERTLYP